MKLLADCKVEDNKITLYTQHFIDLEDGRYEVEIKEIGKGRSLQQNSMLWAIIGEISKKNCGSLLDNELIYLQLLEMSGAKYTDIVIVPDAYEDFKRMVRHTKVLGKVDDKLAIRVFEGSSTMNTKEMSNLIDFALRYAEENGIVTDYWRDLING